MEFKSKDYWENRYKQNGTSGMGSYGRLYDFKTKVINNCIEKYGIKNMVEFGCGDGNQLKMFNVESYTGYDVSETIINKCKLIFENDVTKTFHLLDDYDGKTYDLSISMDVIFHLVEDEVFFSHMRNLFNSSKNMVLIYSSNGDHSFPTSIHVRDRNFTEWVEKNIINFELIQKIENPYKFNPENINNTSISNFYLYKIKTPRL
jgi:2-polyprenyl-3-methyl-5-hydroxy-6-metoxy-1,4-benzoquinol methylase